MESEEEDDAGGATQLAGWALGRVEDEVLVH